MRLLTRCKVMANQFLAMRNQLIVHRDLVPYPERLITILDTYGQRPITVFDIGVAEGTPWLYQAFPEAKFHLVDPTRESLPHMQRWQGRLNAEIHQVALGAESGSMTIHIRNSIKHASLMKDVTDPDIIDSYDVPVVRFDSQFCEFARPAFCKIDVEGAEMIVLEGMATRLRDFAAIVVETSLNSLYENGPEFSDIMALMHRSGMRFYDFIGLSRRPWEQALHQIDAVFVPLDSPLRVKTWDGGRV